MLLPLTIAFLIGLALGSYLPYLPLTILALLVVSAVILSLRERRAVLARRGGVLLYGALLGGILLWTLAAVWTQHVRPLAQAGQGPVRVVATVVEPGRQAPHRSVMVVAVEEVGAGRHARPAEGRARLTWREPDRVFLTGDRIGFTARLRAPFGTVNPGGFDYAAYLKRQDIQAVAAVYGPGRISLISSGRSRIRWAGWHVIDGWRDRIRRAATATLDGSALGIYLGLIIGERGLVTSELRAWFMATGTVHILSISGSHLGLIALLSFFLIRQTCRSLPARWLLCLSRRITPSRAAALLTIPPVTFYALLAGAEVATIRSLVMILVSLLAVWLGHTKHVLHALAVAALLILIQDPRALLDISFQLSFVSVLAIGLVLRWRDDPGQDEARMRESFRGKAIRKALRWLRDYAWMTGGVTLATLPLVAYYFNQIPWLGLVANLLVVPFAGFIVVPLGLGSALTLLVLGGDTLPFGPLNHACLDLMADVVHGLARIPGSEWHVASPAIPAIGIFYLLLIVACRTGAGSRWRYGAAFGIVLLVAWWGWSPRPLPGGETLRVTFLDVGQGDATVIELPDGRTILIDAGAAYEVLDMGRAVVGPYLWDRGIRRLDLVIGTHPQLDHVGGLPWILQTFGVEEYWSSGIPRREVFYQRLERSIRAQGLVERRATEGQILLSSERCRLTALNPPAQNPPEPGIVRNLSGGSLLNNLSVVTRLDCGPHSFLFAADIESEAMARLGGGGPSLRARVLKVPHHGAGSSLNEEWIRGVGAEAAVISVGRHNRYRHPAPTVVRSYADAGTRLWRTDRDGAVSIIGTLSSPVMTIRTTRDSIPQPVPIGTSTWRSEVGNASRIWTQWMGP